MAHYSNSQNDEDNYNSDEAEADFPGHEALVHRHLKLLFESTAASEAEVTQQDAWEHQKMLQLLLTERESPMYQSSNIVRDYRRRRFPFLYCKKFRGKNEAQTDTAEGGGIIDGEATAEQLDAGAQSVQETDNSEAQLTGEIVSANQSAAADPVPLPIGSANQSNAQLDVEKENESEEIPSTVFTPETIAAQVGARSRGSGYCNPSSVVSNSVAFSSKQLDRNQALLVSNLMVWHRYSEIPFDISSSEFTVKTPVLPLVQGGHLVFLMSKCSQRTRHYSVKIIKKANSGFGSGSRAKRRQSLVNQTAVINKDEFLVLKKLAHPFVASLLYFCENQTLYYYFFPQYSLANLGSNASMYMRIDVKACVYVTCCIMNAVEYLYRNCIVHRDISSKCVLFNADFKPVLFHFDYATFYGTLRSSEARLTFLPEMSSRAPEVISSDICKTCEPEHYVNCDIWGIGVLLGELLLNTLVMMRALKRKLDLHWVFSVREGGPDDMAIGRAHPVVPKELMELLRLCLRKFPQDRPTIYTLMQNPVFLKYDVTNVYTIHCKPSPLVSDFHRLL